MHACARHWQANHSMKEVVLAVFDKNLQLFPDNIFKHSLKYIKLVINSSFFFRYRLNSAYNFWLKYFFGVKNDL